MSYEYSSARRRRTVPGARTRPERTRLSMRPVRESRASRRHSPPSAAYHVDGSLAAMFRWNVVSLRAATRVRTAFTWGWSRGWISGLRTGPDIAVHPPSVHDLIIAPKAA